MPCTKYIVDELSKTLFSAMKIAVKSATSRAPWGSALWTPPHQGPYADPLDPTPLVANPPHENSLATPVEWRLLLKYQGISITLVLLSEVEGFRRVKIHEGHH